MQAFDGKQEEVVRNFRYSDSKPKVGVNLETGIASGDSDEQRTSVTKTRQEARVILRL